MNTDIQKMNLEQKLVELRKLLPYIQKKKQSQYISYKSAKVDDIWQMIQGKMNEIGVNTRVNNETNAKWETYERSTKKGKETMYLYESDIEVLWIDADNPDDKITKILHAIGTNNDPAKAKGSAWTYAIKYDVFMQFSVPMGDLDPDTFDYSQVQKIQKVEKKNAVRENKPTQQPQTPPKHQNIKSGAKPKLSTQAQIKKIHATLKAKGKSEDNARDYTNKKYGTRHFSELTQLQATGFIEALEGM